MSDAVTQVTAEAARQSGAVRRSVFWILGGGAFGLAYSITTTAAYLPPLLHRFTESGTLIGLVLGAEGVFALTLSPVIGPWSDTFHTPMGRRRPFMFAALGPLGFCLLLMPFMPNLWTTTLIVLAFFFAYYVYEPPYRGLYPDVLRPCAGDPACPARDCARRCTRRRWFPAQALARRSVRSRGLRDHGGVRNPDPLHQRGRWARSCLRGGRGVFQAELVDLPTGSGGPSLPVLQRRLGGDVRGGTHVRRAVRPRRPE